MLSFDIHHKKIIMFASDEAVRNDFQADAEDASIIQLSALAERVAILEAARVVDLVEQLESMSRQVAALNAIIAELLTPPV